MKNYVKSSILFTLVLGVFGSEQAIAASDELKQNPNFQSLIESLNQVPADGSLITGRNLKKQKKRKIKSKSIKYKRNFNIK